MTSASTVMQTGVKPTTNQAMVVQSIAKANNPMSRLAGNNPVLTKVGFKELEEPTSALIRRETREGVDNMLS